MNRYILAFFFFSFLGWIWESIYCTICERKWANRGFLYGPVCPIYGFGSVLALCVYDLMASGYLPNLDWWIIFVIGFVVSMVLEYPTSWVLEKLFHARWWDYSKVPLNINGRTSIPTSIAFGGSAILLVRILIPVTDKMISLLPEPLMNVIVLVLVSLISVDATLTISALTDFQKRVSAIDKGFQTKMTDIVNQIFTAQSEFYQKAVRRIAVFELPERKREISRQLREKKFEELLRDYYNSDIVRQMDNYIQHGKTTTFEHCENVAWVSYLINEKLHLNADEKELIEAALLHDLFLYDWHDGDPARKTHGFEHPNIASNNAAKYFNISKKQQDAIRSHMWPLNITTIPKSKEALIICLADKYCALIETIRRNKSVRLK